LVLDPDATVEDQRANEIEAGLSGGQSVNDVVPADWR
jgi:hypothetical protein